MAEESKLFSMQEVIEGITNKLVYRHPHVFGDVSVRDAGEVLLNWEKLKRAEKKDRKYLLDGIPKDLPALLTADKLQSKAAKVGFDFANVEAAKDKILEELQETLEAIKLGEEEKIEEEMGDLLFSVVNFARLKHINPEIALLKSDAVRYLDS